MKPIPKNLGDYYPESYYEFPSTMAEHAAVAERLQQWKLDVILQYRSSGKLLEIGPAYGLFAYLAKRSGFDVTVIEMDARSCTYLRDMVEVDVVENSDTLNALTQISSCDVIAMWQVIEHIPDPWPTLEAAAASLAPGGVLVLDTPNPEAFQFAVLGHRWAHLDAPRHVALLPAELLVERMRGIGLEPVYLSDTRASGFNGFGWGHTFENALGHNAIGRAANLAGRALAKLLSPIEQSGFSGATYVAAFRKPELPA